MKLKSNKIVKKRCSRVIKKSLNKKHDIPDHKHKSKAIKTAIKHFFNLTNEL